MLNVEETIDILLSYSIQKDSFSRLFSFSIGSLFVLDILRGQAAEINLLQLVPGIYFGILLIIFIFLLIVSDIFIQIPFNLDIQKTIGTKVPFRFNRKMNIKISFLFYTIGVFIIAGIIIPISIECLTNYTEKTLDNTWSFQDLNILEWNLFYLLTFLFQIPFRLTIGTYPEQIIRLSILSFKDYLFFTSIFAGIITPTVDVITQIVIILVGITFYFSIQLFFRKQTLIKIQTLF